MDVLAGRLTFSGPSALQGAGTLQTAAGGALKLFRLPGDDAYSYRTADASGAAVEVAIGVPTNLVRTGFEVVVCDAVPAKRVCSGSGIWPSGAPARRPV